MSLITIVIGVALRVLRPKLNRREKKVFNSLIIAFSSGVLFGDFEHFSVTGAVELWLRWVSRVYFIVVDDDESRWGSFLIIIDAKSINFRFHLRSHRNRPSKFISLWLNSLVKLNFYFLPQRLIQTIAIRPTRQFKELGQHKELVNILFNFSSGMITFFHRRIEAPSGIFMAVWLFVCSLLLIIQQNFTSAETTLRTGGRRMQYEVEVVYLQPNKISVN